MLLETCNLTRLIAERIMNAVVLVLTMCLKYLRTKIQFFFWAKSFDRICAGEVWNEVLCAFPLSGIISRSDTRGQVRVTIAHLNGSVPNKKSSSIANMREIFANPALYNNQNATSVVPLFVADYHYLCILFILQLDRTADSWRINNILK